jgi:hypothetical protein
MIIIESLGAVERRYSDLGVKLRQIETDTLWNDAVNTIPCRFTYEETEIPCDPVELSAEELLDIIVGEEAE